MSKIIKNLTEKGVFVTKAQKETRETASFIWDEADKATWKRSTLEEEAALLSLVVCPSGVRLQSQETGKFIKSTGPKAKLLMDVLLQEAHASRKWEIERAVLAAQVEEEMEAMDPTIDEMNDEMAGGYGLGGLGAEYDDNKIRYFSNPVTGEEMVCEGRMAFVEALEVYGEGAETEVTNGPTAEPMDALLAEAISAESQIEEIQEKIVEMEFNASRYGADWPEEIEAMKAEIVELKELIRKGCTSVADSWSPWNTATGSSESEGVDSPAPMEWVKTIKTWRKTDDGYMVRHETNQILRENRVKGEKVEVVQGHNSTGLDVTLTWDETCTWAERLNDLKADKAFEAGYWTRRYNAETKESRKPNQGVIDALGYNEDAMAYRKDLALKFGLQVKNLQAKIQEVWAGIDSKDKKSVLGICTRLQKVIKAVCMEKVPVMIGGEPVMALWQDGKPSCYVLKGRELLITEAGWRLGKSMDGKLSKVNRILGSGMVEATAKTVVAHTIAKMVCPLMPEKGLAFGKLWAEAWGNPVAIAQRPDGRWIPRENRFSKGLQSLDTVILGRTLKSYML